MTTQIPGTISFFENRVKWNAADRSHGHDLAIITPYVNSPGSYRVMAQDNGTGFQIQVGPLFGSIAAAEKWCESYQDWPLLRPHIDTLPVRP